MVQSRSPPRDASAGKHRARERPESGRVVAGLRWRGGARAVDERRVMGAAIELDDAFGAGFLESDGEWIARVVAQERDEDAPGARDSERRARAEVTAFARPFRYAVGIGEQRKLYALFVRVKRRGFARCENARWLRRSEHERCESVLERDRRRRSEREAEPRRHRRVTELERCE